MARTIGLAPQQAAASGVHQEGSLTNAQSHPVRLAWLLAVLLAALRVAWVWPWLLTLGAWMAPSYEQPLLPLWTLFALLLGGRAAAQLATARMRSLRQARVWMAVLGPLLTLLPTLVLTRKYLKV